MTQDKTLEYETQGEIYSFSKDRKSINILNQWFHSFTPITLFEKGDMVKLVVKDKKVNNKVFSNIVSIERVNQEKDLRPEWNKDNSKELYGRCEENLNNLTNTDRNCILLCAKDLFLAKEFKTLEDAVKRIKEIRSSI